MKVRARWNVKDGSGWHDADDVFETTSDLGDAVEILDEPKDETPVKQAETEKEPETEKAPEKAEATVKTRNSAKRRTGTR